MIIDQSGGTSSSSTALYYGFDSGGSFLCGPTTPAIVAGDGMQSMGVIQFGIGSVMDSSMGQS